MNGWSDVHMTISKSHSCSSEKNRPNVVLNYVVTFQINSRDVAMQLGDTRLFHIHTITLDSPRPTSTIPSFIQLYFPVFPGMPQTDPIVCTGEAIPPHTRRHHSITRILHEASLYLKPSFITTESLSKVPPGPRWLSCRSLSHAALYPRRTNTLTSH